MAEDDRTFRTSTPQANRAEMQGLGVGQKEMNAQQAPNRDQHATDPQRLEPFENDPAGAGDDRGRGSSDMGAAAASAGQRGESRSFDERNAAGIDDAGDLGAGTPPGVDIHDIGQDDNPEQAWGHEAEEGVTYSATGSRKGVKTEAERGQGRLTRQRTKDIISRRG
ncbi:hypothetical protein [Phenylobacterium soli]|uniref:Uncharacterized protein n=1 Tax=Phenylobacterium soli TaxID=2170551 RepID=A0A328AFQ3_9CAUL|nr:hypothetical protein [Phenylobacterium soli]RAK53365.1 hypothetical protein DJ017_01885 [Phenylobacterium soli]